MPGDIAECIYPGPWFDETGPTEGPALGSQSMVAGVFLGTRCEGKISAFALRFVGMPRGRGWASTSFRKVVLTEKGADRVVGVDRPVRPKVDA